ncbi:MAG: SDR family NAD(P)-dependent oxidoreductase [Pseudomonadota bacterium]
MSENMMSMTGKIALVTGAGAGIGQAIALAFADHGAHVAAADINNASASRTAEKVCERGVRGLAVLADCGDVQSIGRMVARVVDEFGRLDVIVNNAGTSRAALIMDLTEDDWDRTLRLNTKGVFFCLQTAAREMIRHGEGGRIINIASISGRGWPLASNAIYAASKGAVIALTATAAQQLGPHNITVNSICPGVTITDLVTRVYEGRVDSTGKSVDEQLAMAEKAIPLGRANSTQDIAAMAVFLSSVGGRNITGQCYNVDGGLVSN